MVNKKLMHDIITFCNNYIDNNNIVTHIGKYPNHLTVDFHIWTLIENSIGDFIGSIRGNIHNEKEFIEFKQQVLERLPKLLDKLKQN